MIFMLCQARSTCLNRNHEPKVFTWSSGNAYNTIPNTAASPNKYQDYIHKALWNILNLHSDQPSCFQTFSKQETNKEEIF